MRFTRIDVEGFGILHDTVIDELGPGLTVIGGPNGAGKSSLHAFLTRTLFGIPRSNAVDVTRHFEPLRGGRQGGLVEVADADGEVWRIRRIKGGNPTLEVDGPNGTSISRDALRPLVGDLDRERFEQLFAIDLDRLVGIEDLPGDQLQQMLFDAAVLGTAGSLRGARDLASDRAEQLYKPNGKVQPIAEVRRERREVEGRLADAQARVAGLEQLRRTATEADEQRDRLTQQLEQLDREISLLERVKQAWPRHGEARSHRERATELAGADVPSELRASIEEARTSREQARDRRDELAESLDERRTELARIEIDDHVLDQADAIERLHTARAVHEDRRQRHAGAEERHRAAAAAATQAVERIGPSWTPAQVAEVAVDGAAVDRVRDAAGSLRDARTAHREASQRAEGAAVEVDRRSEAIARRATDLDETVSPEQLQARAEAVTSLRTHLPVLEEAAARARLHAGTATGGAATEGSRSSSLVLATALLAVGIAALLAALVLSQVLVAVGGVLLAGAGAFLVGWARSAAGDGDTTPAWSPPAERERLQAEVAAAARLLDLPVRPDLGDLARSEAQLDSHKEQAAARRAAERDLDERRRELEDARALADDLRGQAATAAAGVEAAQQELVESCIGVGLTVGDDPEPDAVVNLHQRVADAAGALDDVETAEAEVGELAVRLEAFRAEAAHVCAEVGRASLADDEAVHTIPALHDDLREAREECRRQRQLTEEIEELERDLIDAEGELEACAAVLDDACATLGIASVDEVDALVSRHDERRRCLEAAEAAAAEVDRLLGHGEAADRARSLLDAGEVARWDARLERLAEDRTELLGQRDELLEQRTLAEKEIEELGGDDTIPKLALRVEMLHEQLDELSHRWAVLEVARRVLDEAVEHFESQQQPVVLEAASGLFGDFTCGEWDEVRQVDQRLYATRSGQRELIGAEQLSTGEQAQLYLALRVALATHRDGRLPLLLDDLLQSSDDERSAAICATLATLATDRQVLLFTPSQRLLEAVLDEVPGAGHVLLDGGDVVEANPGCAVARSDAGGHAA